VYGIRPTHGRIAMDGACPLAPMFDTCGWFARDAALFARIGDVLLGGRAGTPGRLLVADDAFGAAMPGIADALQPAVQRMTKVYGHAEHVQLSAHGLSAWYEVFRVLQFADIWSTHQEWITRVHPTFGAQIAPRFAAAAAVTSEQVTMMTAERARIREQLDAMLVDRAVLIVPTMPDIAPLRGLPAQETITFRERALSVLCIAGLGGLPQVSLPLTVVHGCPVGLSLIAARGEDEMLLDMARMLA
jgi:amidase